MQYWRTYPLSIHEANLDRSIGEEIIATDILALCKARVEDERVELLLHGLSADLVCFHGEPVGLC